MRTSGRRRPSRVARSHSAIALAAVSRSSPSGLEAALFVIDDGLIGFERPYTRRLALQAETGPARGHAIVHLAPQRSALGKYRQVTVLLARVDQCLRPVGSLLGRVLAGIEPGAPRVAQNVDVVDWIAARSHGPDDLVHVLGVNVFVHGDDPFRVIRPARD